MWKLSLISLKKYEHKSTLDTLLSGGIFILAAIRFLKFDIYGRRLRLRRISLWNNDPLLRDTTLLENFLGSQWQQCVVVSGTYFRVFGTLIAFYEHCLYITLTLYQCCFFYSVLKTLSIKLANRVVKQELYCNIVLLIRPIKM